MRLATFNILHGRSLHDGLVEPERLRDAVRGLDADVLGLQEVDRNQPRSGGHDLAAVAAEAIGAVAHRFVPAVVGTPGEEFRAATDSESAHDLPQYGVALASRWPVERWLVHRLPAAPGRSPMPVGPGKIVLMPDEPRVLLAAVIGTPAGRYTVATTHLSWVPGWNFRQLRRVVRALRALPGPRILLGDLNLPARVAGFATGWRVAAGGATFPSPDPRIQLDHVLLDPTVDRRVVEVTTPVVPVSDHRPLVVRLD
ncbi:endonuclease/exonuclease/phosphatase [Virgisporangium aliadipatigenens]|uniref:Endonuclease/exonuclease/phosphatase n=1 Tax=Virgisporangium aliadipatigenens TaxID=741659 RepID=A0A8J3YQX9_9ACTN|nr:endonuclease/exonuclease/phosphatase family protein [Virgisporangium aliadipatigenens]GIJ48708.1 endonuclease/exonuclease/phosphatase [Virgisporangium aliadipatigenens]